MRVNAVTIRLSAESRWQLRSSQVTGDCLSIFLSPLLIALSLMQPTAVNAGKSAEPEQGMPQRGAEVEGRFGALPH